MTRVVVVGAGIGGLTAAIDLAASGFDVTLLERHDAPGGKMREVVIDNRGIDSGPTVFTMRWVFDELFAAAGASLDERLPLVAATVLARHSWLDGSRLDLYADVDKSVAAIEDFAGAREAAAYRQFAAESASMFDTLDHTFMRREKPGPVGLTMSLGIGGIPRLAATKPFTSLWRELGRRFADPRLRQLFGRYATYCGSSPLEAPATLMLIAHAERAGVWYVKGGMQRFAESLAELAAELGVEARYGVEVTELVVERRKTSGVRLADGSALSADAVVYNGDVAALTGGLLGSAATLAVADRRKEPRSLSAITWSLVAEADGFSLEHHNVFFGDDYPVEFERIFDDATVRDDPTVYICAPDRSDASVATSSERLFVLVNAPPRVFAGSEIAAIEANTFEFLARHGLSISLTAGCVRTTPDDYAARYPGSNGAIYGWPTHGFDGTFRRHGSRSRIAGLYLAGGTVHPGPGIPMTALSGRIAAAAVRKDLAG